MTVKLTERLRRYSVGIDDCGMLHYLDSVTVFLA